jgi:acetylornithine/N-succinyldiaminopimelate aminotransferase
MLIRGKKRIKMKPLDIYHQYPIELISGKYSVVSDSEGKEYIDFYGGHGVISIGHSHPNFVNAITDQLDKLAFYSNAFKNSLQFKLAELLGKASGYETYDLFLSNSGAEANENALKVASFCTGRSKILAIKGAFHGRSAGAVAITDNKGIQPNFGSEMQVDFIEMNDHENLDKLLSTKDYAAFIIEGIQGVNGIWEGNADFWFAARLLCTNTGTVLIADEVQSGYGRTGKFFAHQFNKVITDVITVGKGMGNGFPVAGTLISPYLKLEKGKLGTTFGGGQLACAAAISVLETINAENQIDNAAEIGEHLLSELDKLNGVKALRGRGLMLSIEFDADAKAIRQKLINDYGFITGFSNPDILRILPPLNVSKTDAEKFLKALKSILENI